MNGPNSDVGRGPSLTRVGPCRMSGFASGALTDAVAEESVSQTRACAAALGDASGITSGLADWRKTSAIAAIVPNSLRSGMHIFPLLRNRKSANRFTLN